ncbi:MAG: site-specific DNA-methyltransferase [Prevotellaceae bacterium]|jgi:site-specific DNA-methyltransferase (adenine-specific)|nr:site-specific DNA-methyltransferase [Prevotellaceae bacterium]
MVKKERAKRNKTITLSPDEYACFAQKICNLKGIKRIEIEDILNKTINNNLFDIIDYLPQQFADLIIIDPPYNLTKEFNGFTFKSSSKDEYLNYLRSWFPQIVLMLKPSGSLYLCGDWKCTAALQQVMDENLTVINRITWQREKGRGASHNWKNAMEDIWFGVKDVKNYYFDVESVKQKRKVIAPYRQNGKPKDWEQTDEGNFRLTYPSNFWDDISIPYWSMSENTDHPTQKPEKLIAKLILSGCPENGIVFDPFLGSGTTSVVAKKLNRQYVGIEMNAEYCCWAEKRLQLADTERSIQGYSDGIFWERNTANLQVKK